jgi:hypothetical protein
MTLNNTVAELITQVRDITDEDNITDVTDAVVIRMLNRAQQEMVRILTRQYKNHFMREQIYTSADWTADANGQSRVLKMSSQAFGFAVNSIDAKIGTSWFPVHQVPFSYTLGFDNPTGSSIPLNYAIQGNDIYLYPAPDTNTQVRVRYQFRAPQMVPELGRITDYSSANNTVTLDTIAANLTTSVDTLGAFVNVVDHLTGEIKATMQVSGFVESTKIVSLKSASLDRDTVFGYTTTTTLPTTISKDDYVCPANGTCVPLLAHDLTNFLVDIAGFYVKRKLGIVDSADFADRETIIKAISSMQFGREYTKKIQRKSLTGAYSMQHWFRGN